ncbi:hypothetical protein GH714_031933 [Hevea brasiliensis]|uniref:Integrase catalytic domain-containing protein n=1 Tax=Hevea brasiliensis TaxID=3981 RepID=A0A6A6L6A3_HEVBR|nr:hypothetical protein GH714_031933 [Hevea brasiliensis]
MSDDKTLTKIPHFDGHYDHWSELMENLLRAKGLWSLIENGFEEPKQEMRLTEAQQAQLDDAKTKDHQVKHYLFQAIDRTVFEQILDRRTTKIVWDSLKKKFGGNLKVKKSLLNALLREFEVLEMKRDETITEYFARVMVVANKMRNNGEEMTDTKIVEKILRTLTDKFTYVCVSIEESKDIETMSVDELQSTLVVHEQKFRRVHREDEDQVLKIEGRSNSTSRGRGSYRGRGRGRGRAVFNKATVECYKCHDLGHFQYECPNSSKEANYAELEEEDELLLMAYVELHETSRSDAWFVDSGCSNHMCGNSKMFSNLDTDFTHSVKLGNNTRMKVTGKGVIKLFLQGVCYTVSDVYCVPELKNNLLSVGQLQEKGVAILFKDGVCSLYHPLKGKMAESVMSANRMFILLGETPTTVVNENCFQVGSTDESILWHNRYGHLSYKGLHTLTDKNMVFGLPKISTPTSPCEACVKGKQHRNPIPKRSNWRATEQLGLVHADIVEIDRLLQLRTAIRVLVEKEIGFPIKCLRTDRGGEFNSTEFTDFCKQQGVKRQLTMAYTPQQNGVAERKNQTVMNLVRAILTEKQIPKVFWPEAVQWTFHILNRSPTLAVKDKTPEEAWSGEKPSVDYFRVFGCVGHVHIPDAKRTKLEVKSTSCVFFGFSQESKGYRMYDPIAKKIVYSRDVVFEENRAWDWSTDSQEKQLLELEWGNDISTTEEEHSAGQNNTGDTDVILPTEGTSDLERDLGAREGRTRRPPYD